MTQPNAVCIRATTLIDNARRCVLVDPRAVERGAVRRDSNCYQRRPPSFVLQTSDRKWVYVEGPSSITDGHSTYLFGSPTFIWRATTASNHPGSTRDTLATAVSTSGAVGAIITEEQWNAIAIAAPVASSSIHFVRAIRETARSARVFWVTSPDSDRVRDERWNELWTAVFNGRVWSTPERVLRTSGAFAWNSASGAALSITTIPSVAIGTSSADGRWNGVLLVTHSGHRWSVDTIATTVAIPHYIAASGTREGIAIAFSADLGLASSGGRVVGPPGIYLVERPSRHGNAGAAAQMAGLLQPVWTSPDRAVASVHLFTIHADDLALIWNEQADKPGSGDRVTGMVRHGPARMWDASVDVVGSGGVTDVRTAQLDDSSVLIVGTLRTENRTVSAIWDPNRLATNRLEDVPAGIAPAWIVVGRSGVPTYLAQAHGQRVRTASGAFEIEPVIELLRLPNICRLAVPHR